MTLSDDRKKLADHAAQAALRDIVWMLDSDGSVQKADELDGVKVVALLRKSWTRLDPDKDGITRVELLNALRNPRSFTPEEYTVLHLLSKYFDMIINFSDDEDGEETRITRKDAAVLAQFLLHSNHTLASLSRWLEDPSRRSTSVDTIAPPPLAGD
ncbi:MAG TPA: hypothetical protein V6C81_24085 [Planktothrix sp.]|jgi:hypothetical protein